jgi:hypothetical protein
MTYAAVKVPGNCFLKSKADGFKDNNVSVVLDGDS